ncbi:MAG: sigma-70 family RNA polymerase sigma factor [Bacteroidota bacterium]
MSWNRFNKQSDNFLIQLFLNGNRLEKAKAGNKLYGRHLDYVVKRIKRKYHLSENEAIEIYLDGVANALINIANGTFRSDSNFKTYLFRISRNKAVDFIRGKRRGRDGSGQEIVSFLNVEELGTTTLHQGIWSLMEDELERADLIQKIDTLIDKLDDKRCRSIFSLLKKEMRISEISQELGKAVQTIKNKKSECRKKLMALIEMDPELLELMETYYDRTIAVEKDHKHG